jgi:hypothetical protein
MRVKTMRPAQPVALDKQGNSGLGRAFAVAIVFTGGLYTIATTLMGMV